MKIEITSPPTSTFADLSVGMTFRFKDKNDINLAIVPSGNVNYINLVSNRMGYSRSSQVVVLDAYKVVPA